MKPQTLVKILFAVALVVCCDVAAAAEPVQKQYAKILRKYDIPLEARQLRDTTANAFWNIAIGWDLELSKFEANMLKNKDVERTAAERYALLPRFYSRYSQFILPAMDSICTSLLRKIGITDPTIELHIIEAAEQMPFTALTDNGYAILIPTALYDRPGLTDDMLISFVVREYTHCALKHRFRDIYAIALDEKHKQVRDGIFGTLLIGTTIALAATDNLAYEPSDYTVIEINSNNVNVENPTPAPLPLAAFYDYDFTANQIYQSDLWAYRFMDWLGKGDAYLESIRFSAADGVDPRLYDNWPTTQQRLSFLRFAMQTEP